jgi:small ubiquitin-related modifier
MAARKCAPVRQFILSQAHTCSPAGQQFTFRPLPPGGVFIFKGKTAKEVHAERDRAEEEDRGINDIVEDMHQHPRDSGVKQGCIALTNLAIEPVEPVEPVEPEYINVGVGPIARADPGHQEHSDSEAEQEGKNVMYFKIKRTEQLKEVFEEYCARKSLQLDQLLFRFNGVTLFGSESPEELDMEDDDVIIVEPIYINIRVGEQKGKNVVYTYFKLKWKTRLQKLMEAYCERQSLHLDQMRFLFDGNRVRDHQTPEDLEMEDDDVIDAMRAMIGGCIAAPIPTTFGLHPNTPGVTYLLSPAALASAGQSVASHLVQQLGGDPAARPCSRPDRVLLTPEQRRTLISLLDETHSSAAGKNQDVQVTVTGERLETLLGVEAVRSLAAAFGEHAYDTIKLRRVEAHGLCVPFHTDYSR